MLTEQQKTQFRQAVDFANGDETGKLDLPLIDTNDEVVETLDTLDNFKKNLTYSYCEVEETDYGQLTILRKAQAYKGQTRQDVYIMDFETARAVFTF